LRGLDLIRHVALGLTPQALRFTPASQAQRLFVQSQARLILPRFSSHQRNTCPICFSFFSPNSLHLNSTVNQLQPELVAVDQFNTQGNS